MIPPVEATWVKGDTRATWTVFLTDSTNNDAPVNLQSSTAKLHIRPVTGVAITPIDAVVADAAGGKLTINCATVAAGAEGLWKGQIKIIDSDAKFQRTHYFYHLVEEAVA